MTASDLTAELDRLHGGPHKFTGRSKRTAIPRQANGLQPIATALIALAVLGWLVLKPEGSANTVPANTVPASQVPTNPVPAGRVSTNTVPAGEGSGVPGGPVAVPATTNASAVASVDTTELAGSQSEIDHEDRLIITHQGRRYGVGRLGDVAILGDLDMRRRHHAGAASARHRSHRGVRRLACAITASRSRFRDRG